MGLPGPFSSPSLKNEKKKKKKKKHSLKISYSFAKKGFLIFQEIVFSSLKLKEEVQLQWTPT